MTSLFSINTIRFILLVLIQVLVLKHINFMGYINPYIYILFIVLYPIKNNRMLFLFLSFLLGLTVDMFLDSQRITYITIVTAIHHFILFLLEIFNFSKILLVLKNTLFSSIFTIILCVLITIIFSRKTK